MKENSSSGGIPAKLSGDAAWRTVTLAQRATLRKSKGGHKTWEVGHESGKRLASLRVSRDFTCMDNAVRPPRFWSLDALRGGCALVVFLSHWHLWSDFVPRGGFERGLRDTLDGIYHLLGAVTWPTGGHHPAVIGFFVLSGFCIHFPFEWKARHLPASPPVWRDYFRSRFLRIMPVYWTACVLGLLFIGVQQWWPASDPLLGLHATANFSHIAVRFLGVAGVYPEEIFAGNYLLNTVAVEMVMYAIYPLIYRFAVRGAWGGLGAGFLLAHGTAVLLLSWVTPYWVFNSVFMLGLFWYAGALAAHLFLARGWRATGAQFGAAWALFLFTKLLPYFYGLTIVKQAAWGLVCMLGLSWVLRLEERRTAGTGGRIIRMLRYSGQLSYTLYAVHTPVIMLTTWALLAGLGGRDYFVQLVTTLATSLAMTLIVHHCIERRFYRPRSLQPSAPSELNLAAGAPADHVPPR
jgi:peptidoglycan/LPS O-acetylase OafA/YrhL